MERAETLEEFYKRKFDWVPEHIRKDIGHFNLFRFSFTPESKLESIPYRRRDFYKVMLVKGNSSVYYADQVLQVGKAALAFSNPLIPYKWEHLENSEIVYCIFNQHFFSQFGNISQYEIFQPAGHHVFELTNEQVSQVAAVFDKMETELHTDYKYKFDVLRNLVLELIHFGLKLEPNVLLEKQAPNASQRISAMFLELLERQFPIEDNHPKVSLRAASDFACHLNVHVNHLNRAVKEITQKTTTQIIADRILQESKILLKHSTWNVSEIAFALGFTEVTHFNNFFKKHVGTSPLKFRNV